jgi:hypothetical protein
MISKVKTYWQKNTILLYSLIIICYKTNLKYKLRKKILVFRKKLSLYSNKIQASPVQIRYYRGQFKTLLLT